MGLSPAASLQCGILKQSGRGVCLKSCPNGSLALSRFHLEHRTRAMAHIEAASPHTMNTYGRLPIALDHGEGVYVWDVNGKRYLDMLAGIAVNTLGHKHPKL